MLDAKGGLTRRPRKNISSKTKRLIFERDSYTCRQCGLSGKGTTYRQRKTGFEIDHILPNAVGGTSEISNLQVLCRPCNNSKRHYRVNESN